MKKRHSTLIYVSILLLIIVSCNKNTRDAEHKIDISSAQNWFKDSTEKLAKENMKLMLQNGHSIHGNLSWQNAEQYSWQGFAYIEVPYIFNGKKQVTDQSDTLQYSLVLRVLHQNNYSGAIAIIQSTRAKRIAYPWNCDCSCSEESTEMIDADLAFEPKWG